MIPLVSTLRHQGVCYPTHPPFPGSAPACCFWMKTGRVTGNVNYIIIICPKLCNYRYSFLFDNISKGGACNLAHPPFPKSAFAIQCDNLLIHKLKDMNNPPGTVQMQLAVRLSLIQEHL